jgi:hypothetical protein
VRGMSPVRVVKPFAVIAQRTSQRRWRNASGSRGNASHTPSLLSACRTQFRTRVVRDREILGKAGLGAVVAP